MSHEKVGAIDSLVKCCRERERKREREREREKEREIKELKKVAGHTAVQSTKALVG